MKRQRSWNYHTKLLVPVDIANKALSYKTEKETIEEILVWGETERSDHHFKRGDECCHVDNLEQVLHVDKIIRSYPKPYNGEKPKAKIEGILVHWHEKIVCQNCGFSN